MPDTDFDYSRYTPLDNTFDNYDIFKSAYKNIRFALPATQQVTISEPDIANLAGLSYRLYGKTSLWRLLLAYNGLQDAVQDMWPGQILKAPSLGAIIAYLNSQLHNQQQTFVI